MRGSSACYLKANVARPFLLLTILLGYAQQEKNSVLYGAFGADAYKAVLLLLLILRFVRFAHSAQDDSEKWLPTHYSLLTTDYSLLITLSSKTALFLQ